MFAAFPKTPVHDSFPRTPTSATVTKEVFTRSHNGTPTRDIPFVRSPAANKDTFGNMNIRSPVSEAFIARYSPAKDSFGRTLTPTKDASLGLGSSYSIGGATSNGDQYAFRPPSSPKKREHRTARIYTPNSPTNLPARPDTARIQPERPAPLLELPGLPPRELPRSVLPPPKKKFGEDLIKSGRSWLAQVRPPWSKSSSKGRDLDVTIDNSICVIPPVNITPKSSKFADEVASPAYTPRDTHTGFPLPGDEESNPKSAKLSENQGYGAGIGLGDDEYYCDPPPQYRKHDREGLKGWLAVAGAFLIQFCTIGFIFTWNVFEDHYNHVYLTDQNPIAVQFIGNIQMFLAFALSLIAGKLTDMGYFRSVVHPGSFLFALSLLLLSFIGEENFALIFVCQSLGMGIGIGLVFVPTTIVPVYYFKRRRSLAMGIVLSGGCLGSVIFPTVLRLALSNSGFPTALRIVFGIVLGFLLIGNALATYSAPAKQEFEKPTYPLPRLDLAKYSTDMGYLFAAGGTFLGMLIVYFPVMYLNLLGLEKGVDANLSFYTIIILSIAGILGRVGFGFASDIVGLWNLMMPVSFGLALIMFTTCTIQGPKSLGAYAFFYGFFSGAWFSLLLTGLSSFASRKTEIGTRVGLVLSASSFAILVSGILHHGILTSEHNWVIPSAIGGVLFTGVTALMYLSRVSIIAKKSDSSRRLMPAFKLPLFQLPEVLRNVPFLNLKGTSLSLKIFIL